MGLFDDLFSESSGCNSDLDVSVFDDGRFRRRGSSNWVDWEDVSTSDVNTDGFEHPSFDENGEW